MGAISTSSPTLWLKADAIGGLSNADPVATWADSSGNGLDATQATSGNRPTYRTSVVNGLPVVRFDGSNDYLQSSSSASAATQTIIAVVNYTNGSGTPVIVGPSANGGFLTRISANKIQCIKPGTINLATGADTIADSTWHIVASTFDSGASSSVRANGANDLQSTAQTLTASLTVRIGARNSGTDPFAGDMAEVIKWDRALTATEFKDIEAELAAKYALTNQVTERANRKVVTFTASSTAASYAAKNLYDDNLATNAAACWRANAVAPATVAYEFSTAFSAESYTMIARSDVAADAPRDWTFEGSNNGSSWTTLDTRSSVTFSGATPQTFTPSSTGTEYLHYRLNISATSGSNPTLAEWHIEPEPFVAISLTGVTSNVTVAAPVGTVSTVTTGAVNLTGVTADIQIGAPAGTVSAAVSLTGVTADVQIAAPAGDVVAGDGSAPVNLTGETANITIAAPAGTVAAAVSLTGVTANVNVAAPAGAVSTGGEDVDLGLEIGMEVSDLAITFGTETVDLGIELGLEATDIKIHGIETVEFGIELGLHTFTPKAWGESIRTGRPEPRIDIAERDGTLVTTLPKSTLKPLTCGVNVTDSFGFTVDRYDDRARLIQPVEHYAHLWRGDVLMSKGPIGPGRPDESRMSYDCADPRWFFADGRRRIGRIPKRQLLLNPGFTQGSTGLNHWSGGYDTGSALAAAPEASVVDESYAASGKALQLGGVDKVVRTTVETAAVFKGNRPYAWEPLLDGFLSGGQAAITAVANTMAGPSPTVHIIGHTADADSGDGQALSERRAEAAKLVVLERWPSAVVTTEGKGETEPVDPAHNETAYRKNRRVEFEYTQTAVGHRQFYYQRVTVTQPTDNKVPLPLTFAADMRIVTWLGAPLDGWAILVRATRGATVIDEANATMDGFTPRVRWKHYEATVEIPADGIATTVEVRLYPPAGSSKWANVGLWPQDQLGFFDVDQASIVQGIVEHVQDTTLGHGDLSIGTRTPATGILRTKEYPYHERMPADTALEWFTSIDKGMDIDYDQYRNEIVTYYPQQGTSTDLTLIHGGRRSNVVAYKPLSASALALASNLIVQADGSGASRPEGYARDAAALGGTLLEAVISAEEETTLAELDEAAASALAASLRARPGWEVVLDPDFTTEFLDRADKGDTLRWVCLDEDVDGPHRLATYTWDPESDTITAILLEA